jgi:hypothetical protein
LNLARRRTARTPRMIRRIGHFYLSGPRSFCPLSHGSWLSTHPNAVSLDHIDLIGMSAKLSF